MERDASAGERRAVLPYGDRGLLVEVADLAAVAGIRAALERAPLPGQLDLVPAARTLLVVLDRAPAETDVARLRRLEPARSRHRTPTPGPSSSTSSSTAPTWPRWPP